MSEVKSRKPRQQSLDRLMARAKRLESELMSLADGLVEFTRAGVGAHLAALECSVCIREVYRELRDLRLVELMEDPQGALPLDKPPTAS